VSSGTNGPAALPERRIVYPDSLGTSAKLSVTLPLAAEPISEGVSWFAARQSFELKSGASYLLELEWDGGREQQSALLGDLPLLVRW